MRQREKKIVKNEQQLKLNNSAKTMQLKKKRFLSLKLKNMTQLF